MPRPLLEIWREQNRDRGCEPSSLLKIAETVPSRELKSKVMSAANAAGVPLADKDVSVTNAGQGVNIEVLWTVPVVVVNGDAVFAVPLAVRRSSAKR